MGRSMIPKQKIKELIDLIEGTDITEIEVSYNEDTQKIRISRNNTAVGGPIQNAAATNSESQLLTEEVALPEGEKELASGVMEIKAPLVGTFYSSPKPEDPPYVQAGDIVSVGQVICLIEAMKIFNEIESDVSGRVIEVLLENDQPVEFGQPILLVEPL